MVVMMMRCNIKQRPDLTIPIVVPMVRDLHRVLRVYVYTIAENTRDLKTGLRNIFV